MRRFFLFNINTECMDFLEKDLEQIIYDATAEQLQDYDFPSGTKKRQLRIGNYGIADLVYFERVSVGTIMLNKPNPYIQVRSCGLKITVCELKKDKIGISALLQAINYCKGISEYLQKRDFYDFYFDILLVGRDVDNSGSFIYLTDLIGENTRDPYINCDNQEIVDPDIYFNQKVNRISYKTYSYNFDGIKFKDEEGYKLTNSGF